MKHPKRQKIEFGDFQTPLNLARDICSIVLKTGFLPRSVLEPTCGSGAFLQAALEAFPDAKEFLGVDRDPLYVEQARIATSCYSSNTHVSILQGNFFEMDWLSLVEKLPKPILIIGNPPWVTNAALGSLGSSNLPEKKNHDRLRGIDALTGRSNFDISEWMLRQNIEWLSEIRGMLAVLCKTNVARKLLSYAWLQNASLESAELRRIDAQLHFGASVDACLLAMKFQPGERSTECRVYDSLLEEEPKASFGFRDDTIVANIRLYDRWQSLLGRGLSGWRSGLKHDCSRIFELVPKGNGYENGFGVRVDDIEEEVLFPLLKSSDLARNRHPRKMVLVPHRTMASSAESLQYLAPRAWQYLYANRDLLAKRGSSIYRNRPKFSIFGIGEYSFSLWKVAISGLYKKLDFVKVPPFEGRPVLLDDTCYFFPCQSENECNLLYELVQSEPAQEFWSAFIFWDTKRPITANILNLLDLSALARVVDMESEMARVISDRQRVRYTEKESQRLLFREEKYKSFASD